MTIQRQTAELILSCAGCAALFLLLFTSPPTARADSFPTVSYALMNDSTYQEGCFDPCECPLIMEQPMTGSFDLVFYPFAGPIWTVGVENVTWNVSTPSKQITGQGFYRRVGDQQNLRLDLQINGEPSRAFDSGWVAGGDSYPFIDVTLSMNDFFCYDIALHVRAKPDFVRPELTIDGAQLNWSAVPGVTAYDVVCGDLMELRTNGGYFGTSVDACLADALADTVLVEDIVVAPGQAVWFLVRSEGGSYDAGDATQAASRDEGIAASVVACP